MSTSDMMALVSFAITFFTLGVMYGKDHTDRK